jgi:citrate lyase subunit beta / citryl-CoA lyase
VALSVVSKHEVRPIRSLVHVGAANEAAVERALASGGDALFLDLEDPQFPYGSKARESARQAVGEYLGSISDPSQGPRNFVRVSSPKSGRTMGDLRAVMAPSLAGVHLPKTSGPEDIHRMDGILTCIELDYGLPMGSTQIFPFLETAEGIRSAYQVAAASPRVTYMGGMVSRFGDVYQALRYRWTPLGEESLYLRSKVLLDARAAGIRYPVSGVWGGSSTDTEAMRKWAESLRDLGYFGMLTGPDGVDLVNEVFSPTPEEISLWEDILKLGRTAVEDTSPITFRWPDGQAAELHESYVESARMNIEWTRELDL